MIIPNVKKHKTPEAMPAFLRKCRERAGLTQEEMSKKLGCCDAKIRNIETGRSKADYATQYLYEVIAAHATA